MSKMGQELDKRLDENKYEMYEVVKEARILCTCEPYKTDGFQKATFKSLMDRVFELSNKVIAKVEGEHEPLEYGSCYDDEDIEGWYGGDLT